MKTEQEIFADGIARLHFAGGLVRLDLVNLHPEEKDSKGSSKEFDTRIILNLRAFLALHQTMRLLMDRLCEEGIMKKNLTKKLDD